MRILVGLGAVAYGAFRLVQLLRRREQSERVRIWAYIFLIGAGIVLVGAEVALIVMN